ncbi:MAG: rRNA maturation RNase YbeY [Acidobacteria bacterium]|nr:rRNA maturation RNase YbeY [Acidobacteriota bacterium]
MKASIRTTIFDRPSPRLSARSLDAFVAEASRAAGLRGGVTVLITSNSKIRGLNSRFRGKDSPTDVLSFPAGPLGDGCSGDIAVSLDIAARNARELGHSLSEEVRVLILHGILHLAGYDHEEDRGEMEAKETVLRRKLGLPAGLVERSRTPAPSVAPRLSSARSQTSNPSRRRPADPNRRRLRT